MLMEKYMVSYDKTLIGFLWVNEEYKYRYEPFAEGVENRYARHAANNKLVREWGYNHGFKLFPEEKYGSIKIVSLNVDQCMNLAKQFGVMTVPTFVFFKDGGEVEKIVGFRNQRQILELMDKYI